MGATEPVEIKVTVASTATGGLAVAEAISLLGLEGPGARRFIWFLEDCTPGLRMPLPLLESGVIVRLRQEAGGTCDSTVKLRPCRRTQLDRKWKRDARGQGWEYRIEEDWAGARRTLAASCVAEVPDRRLADAVRGKAKWRSVIHAKQVEYLADCADLRINPDGLVALGPIAAGRWDRIDIGEHEVVAERWTIDSLDFLELSIREPGGQTKAVATQAHFEATLRSRNVPVVEGETKTRTVLEYLARTRLDLPGRIH